MVRFPQIWIELKISTYRIRVCFVCTVLFYHSIRIRRCLMIELICESVKIYAFRNPEYTWWTAYGCFIFASIQTPQCLVASPDHVSLKNTCFQNSMCAEATLEELAFSLVLVILCEPVKIESESTCRNFSEEQHVYRWQYKQSPLFQYSCLRVYF